MADNGNSSLFAMDSDRMNLEDKVLSVKFPTDGANCTGSKYSGKPVLLSSELRLCPITCEQIMVSYPAVCGRKNPPTVNCGGAAAANGGGAAATSGGASGPHHSPEVAAEPSQQIQPHQRCFHSVDNTPIVPNSGRAETEGSKMAKGGSPEEEDEDDEEDENDDDDDEDEDEIVGGGVRDHEEDEEDGGDEKCSRKRQRKGMLAFPSPLIQQLSTELTSVVQDGSKSLLEKGHWMKNRLIQLEEQRVTYQYEAFEIEKQRLKWVKFSSKKKREMERDKLKNERMKLENERMLLLLRQKELELIDLHQPPQISSNKRSDPSSITG
ncbi:hypothetical protein HYC85_021836 [Camellia sinensis]|uniref:Uncharacterized protein n=1 Tax=Camellia sinensis TaxID=4442 RepID=A0A7J7GIP3_CAMSI|nr:hypothetical protein HYC85_021836 [Camellia sinensis]